MNPGDPIGWMYNEAYGAPAKRIHVKVKEFEWDFEDSETGAAEAAKFVTDHVGNDWFMVQTPAGMRIFFGKERP